MSDLLLLVVGFVLVVGLIPLSWACAVLVRAISNRWRGG